MRPNDSWLTLTQYGRRARGKSSQYIAQKDFAFKLWRLFSLTHLQYRYVYCFLSFYFCLPAPFDFCVATFDLNKLRICVWSPNLWASLISAIATPFWRHFCCICYLLPAPNHCVNKEMRILYLNTCKNIFRLLGHYSYIKSVNYCVKYLKNIS